MDNALIYSEDGRTIVSCDKTFEGELMLPEGVEIIAERAFRGCKGLTSIIISNSVTTIGDGAFSHCYNLTSVEIPNSVNNIGNNAFYLCERLTSVEIPNSVNNIGNGAFYLCERLTSVEIPNSVISIGDSAFNGCSRLTSVIIGNSVTSVGENAFEGCYGLTSLTIGNSLKQIEFKTFKDCRRLLSIFVNEGNSVFDSRNNCNAIIETASNTLLVGCMSTVIPHSVTSIGNKAFYGCSGLASMDIPNTVINIGKDAFTGTAWYNAQPDGIVYAGLCAYKYKGTMPKGTSVVIKKGTISILREAFCGCEGLKSVDIPDSVERIGSNAFSGCSGLKSVVIPDSVKCVGSGAFYGTAWYDSQPDGLVYAGSCVYRYKGTIPKGTSVEIKKGTTSISDYAFAGCKGLTTLTIPNSVTNIGFLVFSGCEELTSIAVENGNKVYDSRDNCNAIIETATNTLLVGGNLTTIPDSVTSIGAWAFYGRIGLTWVTIPNSVTSIGEGVFCECPHLRTICIPKGTSMKYAELLPDFKEMLDEQEQISTKGTNRRLLLFFDTETTGLPKDWNAPSSDVTNWPRIVQFSWIISDDRGQIISKQNYIVKPVGFSIPPELSKIHGITTERALEKGENLNNILDHFLRNLQQVSYIVGHNISFDKNVVTAELYRTGGDKYVDMFETKPCICTMLSSTNYCRISRYNNEYKWPKLSELYYKLFNKELVDAHDSSVDVQATFDCFWKLKELGVIGNIDIEDNVILENEQFVHINKIRLTTFLFNSSVYSRYGDSTSDFSKRLYTDEWKLFISNERPQNLMFSYPNTLHVMDNGRGINGTYSLKDNNSLLLSIDGESLYLHCVYYNEEIIVFQFDQSNEHLLLYQKHLVFSSVNDIHNYLDRVKQHIDIQRGNARKQKEIELKERADSLIRDIKNRDIELSDKTVESLKSKMKQLCSIVGPEEAKKYQPIIDKAIKDNEEKKRIVEEERREKEEERNRKKNKLIRKISIGFVFLLYAGLWITALYYHFSHEWETCCLLLLWSSILLFFLVIATFFSFRQIILPNGTKIIHIFFGIATIICSCIYIYDWSKFQKCFNDKVFNPFVSKYYYADNDDNPILDYHNFSVIRGDIYLNETAFHLFDKPVKKIIFEQINHSEDLYFINNYIYKNKSGYYLQEAKRILYNTTDQLCRKAKTLGDWKYIISYAPEEYLSDAKEEYEHLDSIVWNDEELAYQNAKSLNTIEAYDKFMVLYGKGKYCHEISTLLSNLKSNGAKRNNAH